jgi:Tol biopolymer transport system component
MPRSASPMIASFSPQSRMAAIIIYSLSLELTTSSQNTTATVQLLTPGEFDVEDVILSNDRKWIIYSSNQDDVDRRHIWRVGVTGVAAPQALTRGETIEVSPVITPDGASTLCLGSSVAKSHQLVDSSLSPT